MREFAVGDLIWRGDLKDRNSEAYRKNHWDFFGKMFDGIAALVQHIDAAKVAPYLRGTNIHLIPLPGVISAKVADLLVGEPPIISSDDKKTNDSIIEIDNNIDIDTLLLEAATKLSAYGQLFCKVWLNEGNPELYWIEPQNTMSYYDRAGKLIEFLFLNFFSIGEKNNQKCGYAVEQYYVENNAAKIKRYCLIVDMRVDANKVKAIAPYSIYDAEAKEEEVLNISCMPIIPIKNLGVAGSNYGISDYEGKEQLFAEIENHLSMISYVLNENADPWILVPPGVVDGNGKFCRTNGKWVQKAQTGETVDIVSWDASLSAAFQQIDKLLDMLLFTCRLSPALFGRESGGVAESGRALKWRSVDTFSMLNRKKRYMTKFIKKMVSVSLEFLGITAGEVKVEYADGVPNDIEEEASYYTSLVDAGLCSQQRAIRNIYDIDELAAQQEIDRINAQKKTDAEMRSDAAVDSAIRAMSTKATT